MYHQYPCSDVHVTWIQPYIKQKTINNKKSHEDIEEEDLKSKEKLEPLDIISLEEKQKEKLKDTKKKDSI